MAVPSSGQLRLRGDIALEVDGLSTGINVSLRTLSAAAGKSAPDNMSEFYGYSASVPPTVTTSGASSTNTSVYITGTVNSDGGATITERGFYFGTSTNATSNPKYVVAGTTGNFNLNRTGLSTDSTYRYWAYAKNGSGTTIGAMQTRATYPTLNYTTQSYRVPGSIQVVHMSFDDITPTNSWQCTDVLHHPYLGSITMDSTSGTTNIVGANIEKTTRLYAKKSGYWGSYGCDTTWQTNVNVPWNNYQNAAYNQHISFLQHCDPTNLGTVSLAQTATGDQYVGGYRWRYNYIGQTHKNVYALSSPYIWNMGAYNRLYN